MDPEQEQIKQFAAGSRAAFEALVIRYQQPAVGFARQYVHDYHIAEDLVQDCFAYLYVYPGKYDFRSSFKTYLFTLVRHKCLDYLRKKGRRKECGGPAEEVLIRERSDPAEEPEQRFLAGEGWSEWERRLDGLKDDYRTAVYLVDVGGLTPREAAAVQGKSSAGFRVTLHRARRQLKEFMEKEEDDPYGRRTFAQWKSGGEESANR